MNRRINHEKWSLHKKKLHLKRRSHKKKTFVPRIIVDTNVWYQLGKDDVLFNKVRDKLTPIYNNLWEMSNTGALYNKLDMVRNGIRKVMVCSKKMIITEPLKYLIKRANKKYRAKTRDYIEQMLLFTQKIANGYYIEEKQKDDFYHYIQQSKNQLKQISDDLNRTALECQKRIKSYKKHRQANTYYLTIKYLDFMARQATNNKFNLKRLPLKEYELLILVLDKLFKDLETGERKYGKGMIYLIYSI